MRLIKADHCFGFYALFILCAEPTWSNENEGVMKGKHSEEDYSRRVFGLERGREKGRLDTQFPMFQIAILTAWIRS